MTSYRTTTETPVRFVRASYESGTVVTVLGPMVDDGACYCRFPGGEETYVAVWRLTQPPSREAAA